MTHLSQTPPDRSTHVILDPQFHYLTFINTFQVEPNNAEALLAALSAATEDLFRYLPGFISVSLHVSCDRQRVVNYAQWRSKADYEAMSQKPEVKEHMKRAAGLALSFDPVDYELRNAVLAERSNG